MVSEERLIYLVGRSTPTRVIPAGLHIPLHTLDRKLDNKHPQAVAGHDNHILAYTHDGPHKHQVLVSVPKSEKVEDHLAKMSLWIRAAQPNEAADAGPEPLHLPHLIEKAATSVTGKSLEELAKAAGDDRPSNLNDLLGDAAVEVRRVATEALARGLKGLAGDGVIGDDDLDVLDPVSLIDALLTEPDALLREPRADHEVDRDSKAVVTTLIHPPGARQVRFSMQIEG